MDSFRKGLAIGGIALTTGLSSCMYDVGDYSAKIDAAHWYRVENTPGAVWRGYTGEHTNKTTLHWNEYQDKVCAKNHVKNTGQLGGSVRLPDIDGNDTISGVRMR